MRNTHKTVLKKERFCFTSARTKHLDQVTVCVCKIQELINTELLINNQTFDTKNHKKKEVRDGTAQYPQPRTLCHECKHKSQQREGEKPPAEKLRKIREDRALVDCE